MIRTPIRIHPEIPAMQRDAYLPFLQALTQIFGEMDRQYREIAFQYDFHCRGCTDSCCLSRFYHYTLLEFFYLKEGIRQLPQAESDRIAAQALAVTRAYAEADRTGNSAGVLCPLNREDRCLLYSHRPMICRMHGIPHRLSHPVRGSLSGPGCHVFEAVGRESDGPCLDRTPGYTALASLEKRLRQRIGNTGKLRLSVADMIVAICGEHST